MGNHCQLPEATAWPVPGRQGWPWGVVSLIGQSSRAMPVTGHVLQQ